MPCTICSGLRMVDAFLQLTLLIPKKWRHVLRPLHSLLYLSAPARLLLPPLPNLNLPLTNIPSGSSCRPHLPSQHHHHHHLYLTHCQWGNDSLFLHHHQRNLTRLLSHLMISSGKPEPPLGSTTYHYRKNRSQQSWLHRPEAGRTRGKSCNTFSKPLG